MTTTIQNCYNEILTNILKTKFNHYPPYRNHGLDLINSNKGNAVIAVELDYLTGATNEFTNTMQKMSLAASILLGGRTLHNSETFDSVSITALECASIKVFFE